MPRHRTTASWVRRARGLAAVLLLIAAGARGAVSADTMDALKANGLAGAGKLTLVDVRTAAERSSYGVPKGSIWIEWQGPEQGAAFVEALRTVQPDAAAPLAFICSVGHRSGQAARLAEREGYRHVFDVAEGVNGSVLGPGWRLWGLPLETGR